MKFRPLHDRVVVRRVESEERTKGGIIIPDTAKEKPQEGEIIAVGPGARDESRQARAARRQGRRPHPVRQMVRHRGQDRRRGAPDHEGVRRHGRHRAVQRRQGRPPERSPPKFLNKRNENGSQRRKILRRRAREDAARRRHPGQRRARYARPEGPQRRPREVVRRPAHHQGRRDGRQGDRARGQVREHGRADGARGGVEDQRHRRRRHHHRDRARPVDRQGRRQVGRRRHEPDGPEARHRPRGRRGGEGPREAVEEDQHLRRGRPGRHDLGQRRQDGRRHDRRGDAEGRQRGRDHGRGGEVARDRARGRRGHAVRPRLHLPVLHHQRREDDRRSRGSLHPALREEALQPAGHAAGAGSRGAVRRVRCSSSPRTSRARRSPRSSSTSCAAA